MPKRSEKRDTAKAEYVERRSRGEKVNLREFADELGVNRKTLRDWKRLDKWDEAVQPPKKKRGGQPGNRNSAGKKNAAGSYPGAPLRNKNAEKDGAYSTVFFDNLTDEEKELIEQTPLGSKAALEHEMKILKFSENKILLKIAEYEDQPEDSLYVSSVLDMREPKGGQDGAKQTMGMYTKDSAFNRVLKLQEALYKIQGRIAKIADSLRMMEEFGVKIELERERLEILRVRATGMVDAPDGEDGPDDLKDIEIEDEQSKESEIAESGRSVGVTGLVHDVNHGRDPLAVHGDPQRFLPVKVRPPFIAVERGFVSRLNPPDQYRYFGAFAPLNGRYGAVIAATELELPIMQRGCSDDLSSLLLTAMSSIPSDVTAHIFP